MTRVPWIVVLGLSLAGLSTTAEAASQIDGRYRMIGKITDSNDGTRGDVRARIYKFTPLCPNAICQKVVLNREGPQGSHFRSILRREGSRIKGTERDRIDCGQGSGHQSVKLSFRVTARENGIATAIKGRALFRINCPGEETFQRAKLFGRRR